MSEATTGIADTPSLDVQKTKLPEKTTPLKVDTKNTHNKSGFVNTFSEQQKAISDFLNQTGNRIVQQIRDGVDQLRGDKNLLKNKEGKPTRYKLIGDGPVSKGGMADIYLAMDLTSKRTKRDSENIVIIKTPNTETLENPDTAEGLQPEAEIMAVKNNPHIVPVLDFDRAVFPDSTEEKPFYVMKYFPKERAESVDRLLEDKGKLGLDECLVMVTQIGGVLDEISPKNPTMPIFKEEIEDVYKEYVRYIPRDETAPGDLTAIHNDIKPSNIIKDKHYGYMLSDFGIFWGPSQNQKISEGITGTPSHMSPEMIEGSEVDSVSDIYGLGVTLFECLTGKLPIEREADPVKMMIKVVTETYKKQPIVDLYPDNIEAQDLLIAFFDSALSKKKSGRPQSGKEFSDKFRVVVEKIKESEKAKDQTH